MEQCFIRKPRRDFKLQISDFKLQTSDFRLQFCVQPFRFSSFSWKSSLTSVRTLDFTQLVICALSRKPRRDFRLQISDFRLQTSDFRLQISDFRLQTSDFRFQTPDSRHQASKSHFCPIPNSHFDFTNQLNMDEEVSGCKLY